MKKRNVFPFIKQRDMTECGTTCLAMIFKYYGLYNVQSTLRELAHVSREGTTLFALGEILRLFGFDGDGYETSYEWLPKIDLPCIVHYQGNHYVVVYKADEKHVWIADPAYGKDKLTKEEFEKKWNGVLLTVTPTDMVFKNKDMLDLVEARRKRETDVRQKFYVSLVRSFKRELWEIGGATFLLQVLALALPLFTQTIIDQVIIYQDKPLLYAILAGLAVIFLTRLLLTFGRNILLTQFKVEFELKFFSNFFHHFIHLTQKYFDGHRREDFINRFQENLKIRQLFSPGVLQSFLDFFAVIIYIAALFFIHSTLAFFVLVFVVIFVVLAIIYTPRLKNLEDKVFHENLRTMGTFLDSLLGIQTVKLMQLERARFWQWKQKYRRALNKVLETQTLSITLQSTLQGLFNFSRIGIYWLGAYMAFTGDITIGGYMAFVAIFTMILNPIENISRLWFIVTSLMVTYARLNDVFIQEPEKTDLLEQDVRIEGDIVVKNLTFRYNPKQEEPILNNMSVALPSGSHVSIVGRNGSGKTTFVKLLVKLYTHYQGTIHFGVSELKKLHPQTLRKRVVMVPQDIYIFAGTIKENILHAKPDATIDELVRAVKLADFYDFVKDNYFGFNYIVGEAGSNLSGGQKLKMAFARLFLTDPEVIILDEATSVLDVESETKIMDNVKSTFKDKTIISIAHRMSTVKDSDMILVFDNGEIVEQGKHKELLDQRGLYYRFMKRYLDF